MAPPAYGDLGKSAKDLFNKHYHAGLVKLDFKSRTPTGVEILVNGVRNNETDRVASSLETKYNIKQHGVTLKQKWNTDNIWVSEATAEDYLVRGLKVGLLTTIAPQSGKKTGRLTCGYKSLPLNLSHEVDFDHSGAVFTGSGVFGYLGWFSGMKVTFDVSKNKLSKSNFAFGYQAPQFHITGHLDDGRLFNCSIYQRMSDQLELGVNSTWSYGAFESEVAKVGLGIHYKIDENFATRAKINSTGQIGVSFIHKLRPGIGLTMSAQMDAKSFSQGGHKLGLGFDLEA